MFTTATVGEVSLIVVLQCGSQIEKYYNTLSMTASVQKDCAWCSPRGQNIPQAN